MGNCSATSPAVVSPSRKPVEAESSEHVTSIDEYLKPLKEEFEAKYQQPPLQTAQLDDFQLQRTVGLGAFSRVMSVKHADRLLALKVMSKRAVIETNQVERVLAEKRILQAIHFPFIIHFVYSFKDNANLYLVLDFASGGEMFTHFKHLKTYPEEHVRFYASQIVLAFEYLHSLNVVYRNLKVEKLLFGSDGYVLLSDFGLAKIVPGLTYTLCGTPQYLAPEIIMGQGHNRGVDYWTLGILLYELTAGSPPYDDTDHMQIFKMILRGEYAAPTHFSADLLDLISKLLEARPAQRYGLLDNGINDIKNHTWFSPIDWIAIFEKRVPAPYVPASNIDHYETYDEQPLTVSDEVLYETEFEGF